MTVDDAEELRLLRAAEHAALEPWALLEAVRDHDGTIVDFVYRDINPVGASHQHRRREELIGRSVAETLPEVARIGLIAQYAHCVDSGEPLILDDFSYTGNTLDGDGVELRRYDLRGVRTDTGHLSLTWRDVHRRYLLQQKVAESEERYRLLAENSWDVVAHVRDGVLVWVSQSATEPSGAPARQWVGRPVQELIPAEDWPVLAEMVAAIATGAVSRRRLRLFDAQGVTHWVDMRGKAFHDANGNRDGETISLRVIDDEVATERELEDVRRRQAASDALYRQSMDSAAVGMALNLPDGSYIDVNTALCDFLGYDRETLLQKTSLDVTAPDSQDPTIAKRDDLLAGRIDSYRLVKQYIHADGHLVWGDLSVGCIRNPDGTVKALVTQVIDMTAQVKLRDELEEARCVAERSRALIRAASDALLDPQVLLEPRHDPSGRITDFIYRDVNKATADYLGLGKEQLLGRGAVETMPGIAEVLLPGYIRCLETGEPLVLNDFSYDNEILDDTRRYDIRVTRATADSIVLTWRDVTDRYRAVEVLAESEEQYRLLAENSGDAVIRIRDGVCIWVSPAIDGVLGAPPQHWVGRPLLDLIVPGQEEAHYARLAALAAGEVVQTRVQLRGFDGTVHWVHLNAKTFTDARGNPDGVVGSLRLIDREVAVEQSAEEARRTRDEAEARYHQLVETDRALLKASADSTLDPQVLFEAVRDTEGKVVDFRYLSINRATTLYLQVSEDDLVGHTILETFPNMLNAGLIERYIQCLSDGEPVILTDFAYFNDILNEARRYDIRATRAGPSLLSLTWSDVTARYRSARRLAASEEKYRLLTQNASDVITHVRDGRFVWVSPSIETMLGAPPEHWIGRNVQEIIPPDDISGFTERMAILDAGGTVQRRVRLNSATGVTHWVYAHSSPFYDADGHQDGFTSTMRLVDDEVAAEAEIEKAHRERARADELYRRSMDNAAIGMCLINPEGGFVEVNAALCEFFGYDADTLTRKTWQELTAPEFLAADLSKVDEMLAGRLDSYRMLKQYVHSSGRLIWGDLSVSCTRNSDGGLEQFISQITDVTATVQANARNAELNRRITAELRSAARYMASIMPTGLAGEVTVTSKYLPSRELGGDCFDYSWIDDDHLIVYLIDVSGHGIEPALLAVSVQNILRSGSLPAGTMLSPTAVLTELNRLFQMEQQGDHFFTMWYGVYDRRTRTLRYANAGAPPALAFAPLPGNRTELTALVAHSAPIGVFEEGRFSSVTYSVRPGSRILIYSDGASELTLPDDEQLSLEGFTALVSGVAESPQWSLDDLVDQLRGLAANGAFTDDLSLLQLAFE